VDVLANGIQDREKIVSFIVFPDELQGRDLIRGEFPDALLRGKRLSGHLVPLPVVDQIAFFVDSDPFSPVFDGANGTDGRHDQHLPSPAKEASSFSSL
jgi:hypothetical protein